MRHGVKAHATAILPKLSRFGAGHCWDERLPGKPMYVDFRSMTKEKEDINLKLMFPRK